MYSEMFLENLRLQIYSRRSEKEKEIRSTSFISLKSEDQKLSLDLEERELNDFAKGLNFEIGTLVKNKNNEIFYVYGVSDMGGLLRIKDVCIQLIKGNGGFLDSFNIYDRKVVKERPLYGVEEHQYMDLYEPADLKISEDGQISLF